MQVPVNAANDLGYTPYVKVSSIQLSVEDNNNYSFVYSATYLHCR